MAVRTAVRAYLGRHVTGLSLVVLLGAWPAPASAQRDPFINAFIEFHSEIAGTYGDEGSRAAAALDRMAAALDGWKAATRQAEAALRSAPGFAPSTLALFYVEAGRPRDALSAIESALRVEPPRAGLHLFHGILLDAAGREAEAVQSFRAAWTLDPDDPVVAYLLAERTAMLEPPPELEPQIASLLAASRRVGAARPRAPFIQVSLIDDHASDTPRLTPEAYVEGVSLFLQGRYDDAIVSFRSALSRDALVADPIGRSDRVARGADALRKGLAGEAIAQLEAAVAENPSSSEAHRILGAAHAAAGAIAASLEHLTAAIRLQTVDERARITLGRVLMDAGRMEEAERALRETVALIPASGRARWALADLSVKLGRGTDAIAQLEAAAALPVPAGRGALLWRLADVAYQLHDREIMVSALARRARLMPNDARAHRSLGLACHLAGRDDQALVELLMSSLLGLEDAEMLAVMGRIHLNAGRLDAAETVLRRAVLMDAKSVEAHYALGRTLMRQGRTVEAQQELAEFERLRIAQLEEHRRKLEFDLQQRTKDLSATPPTE